jgi:hypothetical protein
LCIFIYFFIFLIYFYNCHFSILFFSIYAFLISLFSNLISHLLFSLIYHLFHRLLCFYLFQSISHFLSFLFTCFPLLYTIHLFLIPLLFLCFFLYFYPNCLPGSKLTLVLKDSFTRAKARTVMITTISPVRYDLSCCIMTHALVTKKAKKVQSENQTIKTKTKTKTRTKTLKQHNLLYSPLNLHLICLLHNFL